MAQKMTAADILARLVGFASVVGTPNHDVIAWITEYLRKHGVQATHLPGPEGDRANLFATIGPKHVPGIVLSGHLDVVPAGTGWLADPFVLRVDGAHLIGRGAVDMKGFVAATLAAVPDLVACDLTRSVHLAFSYDEEAGCRGVPHMLEALPKLCAPPLGAIIGEPTGLTPIQRHKGKAALRISASGTPGHSSRPDLGRNAIAALLPVMNAVIDTAENARKRGPYDDHFAPPYSSMQIGTMAGGVALNVIPEHAEIEVEARCVPGEDPMQVLAPIIDAAGSRELNVEILSSYPALDLPDGSPLVGFAERLSGRAAVPAVSFGTEAGLFQKAGIPAIVCGPGDIARAHKPEEYITLSELAEAQKMVMKLPGDSYFGK